MKAKMKKYNTYILIGLLVLSFSQCGRKYGIERFDRPGDDPAVYVKKNGTAVIRSLYCDVYLTQIKDHQWEKLLTNAPLKNQKMRSRIYRVPKVLFYKVVIRNTWNRPIEIEKATIDYGKTSKKSLTHTDFAMKYKSPMYKLFNFEEILRTRRIPGDEKPLEKTNFAIDTIPYRLSYIPPGDRAMKIMAFEKPKTLVREYQITFHLKMLKVKKVIAFNMRRFEYRTRGKSFIKTERKIEDEDRN